MIAHCYQCRCLAQALTNSFFSFTPRPTLLTLPNLAKASATLSKTRFSAAFILSASSELSNVSELLHASSYSVLFSVRLEEVLIAGDWDVL